MIELILFLVKQQIGFEFTTYRPASGMGIYYSLRAIVLLSDDNKAALDVIVKEIATTLGLDPHSSGLDFPIENDKTCEYWVRYEFEIEVKDEKVN